MICSLKLFPLNDSSRLSKLGRLTGHFQTSSCQGPVNALL